MYTQHKWHEKYNLFAANQCRFTQMWIQALPGQGHRFPWCPQFWMTKESPKYSWDKQYISHLTPMATHPLYYFVFCLSHLTLILGACPISVCRGPYSLWLWGLHSMKKPPVPYLWTVTVLPVFLDYKLCCNGKYEWYFLELGKYCWVERCVSWDYIGLYQISLHRSCMDFAFTSNTWGFCFFHTLYARQYDVLLDLLISSNLTRERG